MATQQQSVERANRIPESSQGSAATDGGQRLAPDLFRDQLLPRPNTIESRKQACLRGFAVALIGHHPAALRCCSLTSQAIGVLLRNQV
jgi:hypothetical protein